MNTASQNLAHHLGVLREKLLHATDYEQALYYFLEEFAGDAKFIQQCQPEEALHLLATLTHVAGEALGQKATLEQSRVLRLAEFGFTHGNAAVAGRVVLFFYFEALNTGIMALIPGARGGTEVARFRLTGGLAGNPKHN
ncbi:MAG: hypothetical protein DME25_04875 [Verrucomicrobia bacterium]|nr:MAG: hypothetical protein DME25_04875 [Verrucomicrobiota bacterium]